MNNQNKKALPFAEVLFLLERYYYLLFITHINLSLSVRKMRGIFEKIPLHPKNFRVMGVAEVCKAKNAGLII